MTGWTKVSALAARPRISCRPARDDDLRAVAALWLESWLSIGLDLPTTDTEESLRDRLAEERARGWRVSLAFIDEDLAGFLAITPADGVLNQMFVRPAAKGAGVGTELLALAQRDMPDGFWLWTAEANRAARAFYGRRGLRLDRLRLHPRSGLPMAVYVWP